MSVLAVIPCLNEAAHLPGLLDLFLAQEDIALLVVADGGSTDGSRELVVQRSQSDCRLVLLDNPARIQSAGVNLAVATFGKDLAWLVRIDAHCDYPSGYVRTLLDAAQAHEASSVVVPMATKARGGFQLAVAAAQNSALGTGGSPHRHVTHGRYVDHGHHALMDIRLFRQAGGYCEAMPCNEDAEIDYRFGLLGAAIWLEPDAAIGYYPRRDLRSLAKQYYRYGVGRARNVRRHRLKMKLRQMLPITVALSVLLSPLSLIFWPVAVPALVWLLSCLVAGLLVGAREGKGWALLSGLAAATMHLAWGLGFLAEFVRNPDPVSPRYGLAPLRQTALPEPGSTAP